MANAKRIFSAALVTTAGIAAAGLSAGTAHADDPSGSVTGGENVAAASASIHEALQNNLNHNAIGNDSGILGTDESLNDSVDDWEVANDWTVAPEDVVDTEEIVWGINESPDAVHADEVAEDVLATVNGADN